MKKIISMASILIMILGFGACKKSPKTITTFETDTMKQQLIARRGCCSWHGGVCDCDEATDRIICCDGTYSPSCRCSTY